MRGKREERRKKRVGKGTREKREITYHADNKKSTKEHEEIGGTKLEAGRGGEEEEECPHP